MGPPFKNHKSLGSGLAHDVSGVNLPRAEYGTPSGIQGADDHGSAAYPCKNPGCGNKVQDRGDLCQVCVVCTLLLTPFFECLRPGNSKADLIFIGRSLISTALIRPTRLSMTYEAWQVCPLLLLG